MTNEDRGFEAFERRARDAFDASVDSLDGATLSRLNKARQQALAAGTAAPQAPHGRWGRWAVAGTLAASVLAGALVLRAPTGTVDSTPATAATHEPAVGQESLELLAAGEEFEIATADEDLEFYEWVEVATTDTGNGQG
jgi:hypothetical protein